MKIAPAAVGFGFGTAIGSVEFEELCWSTDTRACALILETIPPKPMNHGRSVSVALMSMYFAEQGRSVAVVAGPGIAEVPGGIDQDVHLGSRGSADLLVVQSERVIRVRAAVVVRLRGQQGV